MGEKTKTGDIEHTRIPGFVWWLVAALAAFVFFYGLNFPFVGPDEPRYAEVAREMLERRDLITPTLAGYPWFEKPVLLYWLEMAGYSVFGVREFAARLGPALCGLGTAISVALIGRSARDGWAGKHLSRWLALMAVSSISIIVFSRATSFDIVLTFCVTAALAGFFAFDQASKGRRVRPLIVFYSFIGLGLLAKGLVGVLLPCGIVAVYYLLSWRSPVKGFLKSVWWGAILAISVASVWYLPMIIRHGDAFVNEFFVQQQFVRFTSNKYLHPQPLWFYLWVLPLMTLPWTPLLLASIWLWLRGLIRDPSDHAFSPFRSPIFRFALAWTIVPVLFFSLSGSKLPGYILPAVPGAVILAGSFFCSRFPSRSKWHIAVFSTAVVTLAAALVVIRLALPIFTEEHSVKFLIRLGDERGFAGSKVLTLHTISYNAEFYAAGRLVRDETGRQRALEGIPEIADILNRENGKPVLVLVPLQHLHQLTGYAGFRTDVLGDNEELAIAAVTPINAVPPG